MLLPVLAAIPLFRLFIWVAVGRGLNPLRAIVKTVVEKHDGTVVLTEPSDHSGLLVRVSLPAE